jgi:hypothetical protein
MLLCLMVSMLAGCGAKKPAVLTRTDSVRVTKVVKDTVYWDRIVLRYVERAKTDKIVNRDSTATTVDEDGNVKKTEAWHWRDRYVENSLNTLMKDSLEAYKAKVDSLASIGRSRNDVPVPTVRKLSWWERNIEKPIASCIAVIITGALILLTLRYARGRLKSSGKKE